MVIYTIYPPEVVLQPEQTEQRRYVTVDYKGRTIVLEVAADGQTKIARLLSVDPNDYLNPAWQPGATFSFAVETLAPPCRNSIT